MFGQERLGQDAWFEKEEELALSEAAEQLEALASMLRTNKECTLTNQEESVVIAPTENVVLKIDYTKQGRESRAQFQLTWRDDK
ncbi:amphi-Trp domain-containing protein [Bacillus piscicola]|uniref:amphi-Trp domain-containing protein n=1 Tax=Bacillus piscicola TaxID=1632684 RepID=UPI001F088FFB|nr:amphi-Trp domain-containing protein [Bacillus piscicola]